MYLHSETNDTHLLLCALLPRRWAKGTRHKHWWYLKLTYIFPSMTYAVSIWSFCHCCGFKSEALLFGTLRFVPLGYFPCRQSISIEIPMNLLGKASGFERRCIILHIAQNWLSVLTNKVGPAGPSLVSTHSFFLLVARVLQIFISALGPMQSKAQLWNKDSHVSSCLHDSIQSPGSRASGWEERRGPTQYFHIGSCMPKYMIWCFPSRNSSASSL